MLPASLESCLSNREQFCVSEQGSIQSMLEDLIHITHVGSSNGAHHRQNPSGVAGWHAPCSAREVTEGICLVNANVIRHHPCHKDQVCAFFDTLPTPYPTPLPPHQQKSENDPVQGSVLARRSAAVRSFVPHFGHSIIGGRMFLSVRIV